MISSKIKDLKIRNSLRRIEKLRNIKKFFFISMIQKESRPSAIILSFLKDKNSAKADRKHAL